MVHGMALKLIALIGACVLLTTPAVAGAYVETPKYVEEVNNRQNEETVRKHKAAEEQKTAEERKVAEERSQREAAERQHQESERAEAQAKEESQRKANEAAASQCVVPALKGDTLAAARRALRAAHCRLGHVTWPPRGHGRHVVRRQGLRVGSKYPAGTAVAVTLAPVKLGR
jgi:hypothetical protein